MSQLNGIRVVLFLCVLPGHAYAQVPVAINDTLGQQIFSFNHIEYFEDTTGKLTLSDVLLPAWQSKFQGSGTHF